MYATARRPESIADLADRGATTLALDVTDEASMSAAVQTVTEAEGAVGVLINNAGYSQSGAVESVPLEQIRRQFDTNVFGLIRMCQLVLPGMREQGWGKIVNLGSMGGRLMFPGGGIYHSTKYAVEAISDSMRFEVRGFGVDVILIEPGLIVTRFGDDRGRLGQPGRLRPGRRCRRLRRLQPPRGQAHRRGLQGADGQARRRPREGGRHDRRRAGGQAAEGSLRDHPQRASDDRPAPRHSRPCLGSDDARPVPHAQALTASADWQHVGMDADDLFGLPLDRFIPERTALVKSLRSEKRRDEATEVAAIRKPSVAAWAVNQLVRTQKGLVDKLFEAGDALRAAQEEVLAGKGDRQGLRTAVEDERQAVDELITAARGLLTAEGDELSPAVIERVGETLHAAALDEDARREVADGRLQRELQHVGFGPGAATPTKPAKAAKADKPAKPTKADKAAEPKPADRKSEQQREERKRAERERAAALKAARAAEGDTRRAAARAERALELAQDRRDRAAEALSEAEQELEQAQAEAQEAAEAHRSASEQLEQLRD